VRLVLAAAPMVPVLGSSNAWVARHKRRRHEWHLCVGIAEVQGALHRAGHVRGCELGCERRAHASLSQMRACGPAGAQHHHLRSELVREEAHGATVATQVEPPRRLRRVVRLVLPLVLARLLSEQQWMGPGRRRRPVPRSEGTPLQLHTAVGVGVVVVVVVELRGRMLPVHIFVVVVGAVAATAVEGAELERPTWVAVPWRSHAGEGAVVCRQDAMPKVAVAKELSQEHDHTATFATGSSRVRSRRALPS
jgi:hypothetical protein